MKVRHTRGPMSNAPQSLRMGKWRVTFSTHKPATVAHSPTLDIDCSTINPISLSLNLPALLEYPP